MRVEFEILGEETIRRDLLRFGDRAMNMAPAFRAVFEILEQRVEQQFDSRGGQSGGWAPLAESTLRRKRGPQILVETGALKASLISGSDSDAIRDVGPDEAVFGSRVPYGVYHHSTDPRSGLPRRPLVKTDEPTRQEIVRAYQRHIFGVLV